MVGLLFNFFVRVALLRGPTLDCIGCKVMRYSYWEQKGGQSRYRLLSIPTET